MQLHAFLPATPFVFDFHRELTQQFCMFQMKGCFYQSSSSEGSLLNNLSSLSPSSALCSHGHRDLPEWPFGVFYDSYVQLNLCVRISSEIVSCIYATSLLSRTYFRFVLHGSALLSFFDSCSHHIFVKKHTLILMFLLKTNENKQFLGFIWTKNRSSFKILNKILLQNKIGSLLQ